MPAKSKQQQKFFGVVKAMQKGDIPKKGEAGDVADDMSKKDVDKYAGTKHKGLPKKVKKEMISKNRLKEIIREELNNVLIENTGYTVVYRDRALDKTYTAEIPPGISKTEIKKMLKRVVPVGLEIIGIEPLKESVNEGKVDRVVGHTRYKYVGDGRKGKAIVSGPMKDREKEAIIKRAKKAGYVAKPNMGGGVTIHVESVNEASNDTRLSGPFTGDELKKMITRDEETMFFANGQYYQATSAFQDFKDDLSVMDKDGYEDYIDIKDIEFAEATHGFAGVGLDRKKRQIPDAKDLSMINRGRAKAALKQIKTGKRSDGLPGPFTARLFGITSNGDVHPITDEDALNQYSKFGLAEKKL